MSRPAADHAGPAVPFRWPHSLAFAVCATAALLLLWPLLAGQILLGGARSDMFIAGYSFRLFGAQMFLDTGSIPQWNPYLLGGLPYIGAMHGDIFYPTAWLRWIMPVDLAITWGMVLHFVLAGWFMYRFARALGLSWGAAVFSGVAYELTGIVASQMSPGHDGKLFVSALTPLAFWVLLHAIRRERTWAFGAFAITVALIVLGHYHMAYFLLIALGLWALYLSLWDPERPRGVPAWKPLCLAAVAVGVGVGITALQVLPFLAYIPFSPRAARGPDQGWGFATSYALPPSEVFTLALPEFNGVLDHYWGRNPIKFHTEYMGFLPLALACIAVGDRARHRLVVAFGAAVLLFLTFAFAGYTPLYRPFFELLPGLNKIRAMGMVFYLVAFALCVLAGLGMDRVLGKEVRGRTIAAVVGVAALFALFGVAGGLQGLSESMAVPARQAAVEANAPFLRSGALRLLLFVVLGGGVLWATAAGRLGRWAATSALLVLVAMDLWSVDRRFYIFSPRASVVFADDAVTTHLRKVRPPYRVLDAGDSYGHSVLMAYRIPVAMGYHGFQLQRYNELGGATEGWRNLLSPSLLDLLAIRFVILPGAQQVPGYHQVVGPTPTAFGTTAVLYERDAVPAYARVLPASVKAPESQIVPTLADPRYPVSGVALLPDTSTANSPAAQPPFRPSAVSAIVTDWRPGAMTIELQGSEPAVSHLLVSENWYPDWRAEVDGKAGAVRRVNHTLLGVDLPSGAREVRLRFDSAAYARGKLVSAFSLLVAVGWFLVPLLTRRRRASHEVSAPGLG
ncbi:MAG: hypothetical protein JWM95_3491 [Gemmatimonadetes bacterium]|nr:hypothetical protein [Gemmatimonadota bacterium]